MMPGHPQSPCQHGYLTEECEACSPAPRVGQPVEGKPMSSVWWLFLGGVVGAVGLKLVDHFWPKKPQVVYSIPGPPPGTEALPPAGGASGMDVGS